MYSMIKSYEKGLRYYTFRKSAPNHRSLTLRIDKGSRCVLRCTSILLIILLVILLL